VLDPRAQTPSALLKETWTIEVTETMGELPRGLQLVGSGRGRPEDFGNYRSVASRRNIHTNVVGPVRIGILWAEELSFGIYYR